MPLLLWMDVWSAETLVWIGSRGLQPDLTDEAHEYFFDRYSRLARHYRGKGQLAKSSRYQQRADEHRTAGFDGPPYAAAVAMPRPRRFIRTNAVSRHRPWGPDDAA